MGEKLPLEIAVNDAIQKNKELHGDKFNTNNISDGYHTFGELYEHRIGLFIALCKMAADWNTDLARNKSYVWRSKKHSDGTEYIGWFLLGIGKDKSNQITYHLPISKWDETDFAETLKQAPEFDGHTSADVLERLKQL